MFSINTNIASLQAQEYLRINQDFQAKTINRVTSGLRIISSGDDAAGLAIANSFRSDRAVLSQGVRNVNDGLSTLQTIDGGLNNISQLLDRARTLAAQSASGTFTGDRSVLDAEFQSTVAEIDRQSQAIGLNVGGTFARNLSVFLGGGRGATAAETISNGSVNVDLSSSTVDAQSLGLKGTQAVGAAATDVDEILADSTNVASEEVSGKTQFFFRGAGFSDDERIGVSVNLSGVSDAGQLVTAINSAIDAAGNGGSTSATAFKNANVRAKLITNSDGTQSVAFASATAAFQVSAGDRLANAVLGNSTSNVGDALDYVVSGSVNVASTGTTFGAARNVIVRVQGGSLDSAIDLTIAVTTSTTVATALSSLTSLVANNSDLVAAGISLDTASSGSALRFTSKRGENFEVLAVNDVSNVLGLGSAQNASDTTVTTFDATSISSTFSTGSGAATLGISVGGGSFITISYTFSSSSTIAEVVAALNNAFASNTTLQQGGLVASSSGSTLTIASNNGSFLRVNSLTSGATYGFGSIAGTAGTTTTTGSSTTSAALVSGGASTSGLLAFSAIRNGNDDQTITISGKDSTGADVALAITLQADSAATRGRTIDEAIAYINDQLQASSNDDLNKIVAVKERDESASGAEKIRFISPLKAFKVSVGTNPNTAGITTSQGTVVDSTQLDGGSTIGIDSVEGASDAVTALGDAVAELGRVQATVGRGQNQFNFAISLAQTQLSNLAASESRIRDADLAAEAANLTKAQILQQAGIAALAQANVAPQAILSLLRG